MSKKTLVMGASLNPQRYSNIAMRRLVSSGHQVVAFGLKQGQVGLVKIDINTLSGMKSIRDALLGFGARISCWTNSIVEKEK